MRAISGAGSGNRTRVISLEGWGSTSELYPLARNTTATSHSYFLDGGGGWIRTTEACASDLQSDPFGHSGTPPTRSPKGQIPWLSHSGAAFYGNWVACAIVSRRFSVRTKSSQCPDKSSHSAVSPKLEFASPRYTPVSPHEHGISLIHG